MPLDMQALSTLGWGPYYQQQLEQDESDSLLPCRVMAVHRGELIISSGKGEDITLIMKGRMLHENQITIGDWIIISPDSGEFIRLLDRKSMIKRQAAGSDHSQQMIAANIDTLFIVTSASQEFNLSRLERYLAFAYNADVTPVLVLTKLDIADDPDHYMDEARSLGSDLIVEGVNAKNPSTLSGLRAWCKAGQTIALLGSSGVGKSTLANSLGAKMQRTGDIRETDGKGRHTTTHRSLLPLEGGAVLLDSPGMRGLGVADCGDGVIEVFSDVIDLANQCRFSDCVHDAEPGCMVKKALDDGSLSPRRLMNFNKLMAEHAHNAATASERRKKDKDFSKLIKKAKGSKVKGQKYYGSDK
jgi:ribosome biogenesis GTPase